MTLESDIRSTPAGNITWLNEKAAFELGNLICETMAATGTTRKQLAQKFGLAQNMFEIGLDQPDLERAIRLLDAMGYELKFEAVKAEEQS